MLKEYDKIKLCTGEIARIVEVLEQDKMYIGEIIRADKRVDIDHIPFKDIASVFVEIERPVAKTIV
ncbi:MAG: hypothetical protein LBK69_08525 [Syntrophomonadaceae bacterium]|jgi:hypothetical protein|nr:hypothetical protein [Syntrophomonadaceae bacterium]